MNILVSGSSGLVGSALIPELSSDGHSVIRLLRKTPESSRDVYWDPEGGALDKAHVEGLDAVIHLAGDSIAEGRWNAAKKISIRDSRVKPTRLLAETLAGLSKPPKVFIVASASGYYGDRGDEVLGEQSEPGAMFLSRICREWEEATNPASEAGIRVVNLRFGVILSTKGGGLAKMLLPFKMGVGGRIGSGNQYWSWIAIEDVVGVINHAIRTDALQGPVNVSTPNPVSNKEFTKTLGKILKRPALFPMPTFAARAAFGEMADELLLCSFRMEPAKLIATGYVFLFPDLESALRHLLG